MTPDLLLSRLDAVRRRGTDQWSARCPAHDDKTPSLSVRETPDGRVLVKCFAECRTADVLAAVGLEMSALYPAAPDAGGGTPPLKRRRLLSAGQALDLLHDEMQFGAGTIASAAYGVEVSDDDKARLLQAAGRIAYLRDEVKS